MTGGDHGPLSHLATHIKLFERVDLDKQEKTKLFTFIK